jgi:predicted glycogen debranching enzyme
MSSPIVNIDSYHFFSSSDSDFWRNTEWIETDGLGGWSSQAWGSLSTRRYHSILLCNEPEGRINYVSQLEEFVKYNDSMIPISTNIHPGVIHPEGYQFLEAHGFGPGVLGRFRIGSGLLTRELIKDKGMPRTLLRYHWSGEVPVELYLTPLFSYRGFHALQHSGTSVLSQIKREGNGICFSPVTGMRSVYAYYTPCHISDHHDWFYRFQYDLEKERGLDFEEDLFSLARFVFTLTPGSDCTFLLSRTPFTGDVRSYFQKTVRKNTASLEEIPYPKGSPLWQLSRSARQCIIKTPRGNTGIVAGYHWFEEWGRDTFISLPYLLDEFSEKEEIYQIFLDFLHARKEGLVPNRFFAGTKDSESISAEYNSVDALLWLSIAAFHVWNRYQDAAFVKEIYPMLKDCFTYFQTGTQFGIQEREGILLAGTHETQLTWMDAKVHGAPVTPRSGAAVEINAGWYNLKKIMAVFSGISGLDEDRDMFSESAERTRTAFRNSFMIRKEGFLADSISETGMDCTFRPNQLFSISMPFPLLEHHEARILLTKIKDRLLTPRGLRTLCSNEPGYVSHFRGTPEERDRAYHQGTVWPWLLIPYWEAARKYARLDLQDHFELLVTDFQKHLDEACTGSVSEVFDGDEPWHYGGTASQAWSIAALLFCIKDLHNLNN